MQRIMQSQQHKFQTKHKSNDQCRRSRDENNHAALDCNSQGEELACHEQQQALRAPAPLEHHEHQLHQHISVSSHAGTGHETKPTSASVATETLTQAGISGNQPWRTKIGMAMPPHPQGFQTYFVHCLKRLPSSPSPTLTWPSTLQIAPGRRALGLLQCLSDRLSLHPCQQPHLALETRNGQHHRGREGSAQAFAGHAESGVQIRPVTEDDDPVLVLHAELLCWSIEVHITIRNNDEKAASLQANYCKSRACQPRKPCGTASMCGWAMNPGYPLLR